MLLLESPFPNLYVSYAVQSTHTSLCVGLWSSQGLIRDGDIKASLGPDDISGEEDEPPMEWDVIHTL